MNTGVINEIEVKLARYPTVRYSRTTDAIEILPIDDSGFTVGLSVSNDNYHVHFDGWHEDFTSQDEALRCFAFGLSSECRLAVVLRGDRASKWTVQSLKDGQWVEDSTVSLLLIPFWRRARVVYRQNNVLAEGG